jgi:cytoplasmic iron level regulating protein YaaA (DUF328/UPF0246 family)
VVEGPTRPAIERYTGVLYRELDAAGLQGPARRRLNARLLIASGLWGFVGPKDPIPAYRLKMGARLAPMGRLSTWWRPRLTEALAEAAAGATVWNLLPAEHAAAVDWDELGARQLVTVRFVDAEGRTVSHWNKLLKGALVRWMVESGARRPADVAEFDHPTGYALDPAASDWDRRRPVLVLRGGATSPALTSGRLRPIGS